MKTAKKGLLMALCAVLLVAASVMGTLAYLTDSEELTNTFTVGKVYITLTEAKTNTDGKPVDENGTIVDGLEKAYRLQATTDTGETVGNTYHLQPGLTYTKDPTVTVEKSSEDAYVRMMATITYSENADIVFAKYGGTNMSGWLNISTDWTCSDAPKTTRENGKISRTYEFRYKEMIEKADSDQTLAALFTMVSVPGGVTNEELATLADMTIAIEAHAIQAASFDDADAAWNAFDNQNG